MVFVRIAILDLDLLMAFVRLLLKLWILSAEFSTETNVLNAHPELDSIMVFAWLLTATAEHLVQTMSVRNVLEALTW